MPERKSPTSVVSHVNLFASLKKIDSCDYRTGADSRLTPLRFDKGDGLTLKTQPAAGWIKRDGQAAINEGLAYGFRIPERMGSHFFYKAEELLLIQIGLSRPVALRSSPRFLSMSR